MLYLSVVSRKFGLNKTLSVTRAAGSRLLQLQKCTAFGSSFYCFVDRLFLVHNDHFPHFFIKIFISIYIDKPNKLLIRYKCSSKQWKGKIHVLSIRKPPRNINNLDLVSNSKLIGTHQLLHRSPKYINLIDVGTDISLNDSSIFLHPEYLTVVKNYKRK